MASEKATIKIGGSGKVILSAPADYLDGAYQWINKNNLIISRVQELDGRTKIFLNPAAITLEAIHDLIERNKQYKEDGLGPIKSDPSFLLFAKRRKQDSRKKETATNTLTTDGVGVDEIPGLKMSLRPWQRTGVAFANAAIYDPIEGGGKQVGVIIADEMGLGKTFEALALLKLRGKKAVIVCPAGLRIQWAQETNKFTDFTSYVVGKNFPELDPKAKTADIIIVSYRMVEKWGWWLFTLIQEQGRALVIDEAHNIRNRGTAQNRNTLMLSKAAVFTVAMTGSPIHNKPTDLQPILTAIRDPLGDISEEDFKKLTSTPNGQRSIKEGLVGRVLRRMKGEVWKDDPGSELQEMPIVLSNQKNYEAAENDFISWLVSRGASQDRLSRAEQGAALVKMNSLRKLSTFGKIREARKLLAKNLAAGNRVVLFSDFKKPLDKLHEALSGCEGEDSEGKKFSGAAIIYGSTPEPKRVEIIRKFQEGSIGALLISTKAGGVGLNLTAAHVAVFLSLPWTPASFEQAFARIYRLGQNEHCVGIKMLSDGIDKRIEAIIVRKAALAVEMLGDEDAVQRVMGASVVGEVLESYIRDYVKKVAHSG